jgi:uncharacterized protein (DUF58 family)
VNDAFPPVRSTTVLTTAGRAAVPAAGASLLASWAFGGVIGLFASSAVAALLLALLLARLHVGGVRVASPSPARAHVGDAFPLELELCNASPSFAAHHLDVATGDGGERGRARCPRIAPGERVRVPVAHRLLRRGRYRTLLVTVATSFPLGLVERRLAFELPCDLLALPRLGSLNDLGRLSRERRQDLPNRAQLARGDEEFYGVRAWRAGMSLRRVHWRLSARRGRRIVREMRREEEAPLHLMLVTTALAGMPLDAPRRRFERAVSLTATLAEHFLRDGRRLRLTLVGPLGERGERDASFEVTRGRAGLLRVLTALAEVEMRPGAPAEVLGALERAHPARAGRRERDEARIAVYVGDGAAPPPARGLVAIDVEHPDADRLFLSGRRWGMGAPLGLRLPVSAGGAR